MALKRFVKPVISFLLMGFSTAFVLAAEQDSLAYVFRQDNLSTGNDLQLNYKHDFGLVTWKITDLLRYKVFAFENSVAEGRQYAVEHQLTSDVAWGNHESRRIRVESNQYQDHRTGLASNISNQALLAGYGRGEMLSLFAGARSIERFGITDRGWTTELDLDQSWHRRQRRSSFRFNGERDDLGEHVSHAAKAQADYAINFARIANFRTALAYDDRAQSFFTDSLGSSQTRLNTNLRWQTHFDYQLARHVQFFHRLSWDDQLTKISQEKVGLLDTFQLAGEDRKRFSLVNEGGVRLLRERLTSETALKVETSQNKYYVDYTQRLYQLSEEMIWSRPGLVDSLRWTSLLSRLEYDTPDTTNDDDRDEWRLNTELAMSWQPTPFYRLELGAKISLFHLIYLFNTRSSENHWNRNLVLWSGYHWQRGDWSGETKTRVRSNYFDYDYDELFLTLEQPTRSFVHRSLDLQQSLQYQFFKRWSLSGKVAARWEDEGQLDWDQFVQQVRSEKQQVETVVKLFYDYRGWKGWVGYLQHDRFTDYTALNRDRETWFGEGPLFGVQHRLGARLYLDADARFIQVQDQTREYMLPKVMVTVVYR
jgi:hypothetical protein